MVNHWSHLDSVIEGPLKNLNVIPLYIPPNTTHLFCVLDLVINKPFKSFYRAEYDAYCVNYITKKLGHQSPDDINLNLSLTVLKPLVGNWISSAWKKLKDSFSERDNAVLF